MRNAEVRKRQVRKLQCDAVRWLDTAVTHFKEPGQGDVNSQEEEKRRASLLHLPMKGQEADTVVIKKYSWGPPWSLVVRLCTSCRGN